MVDVIEYPFNLEYTNSDLFKQLDYDWPIVYFIKGERYVYIGETYNPYKRTKEHLKNEERRLLDKMFVFYDNEYNKSATLDIESQLIQYVAAEESLVLQNKNEGLRNHEYYERERYLAKFEDIWRELQNRGIVNRNLNEIKNSDLFKYSPYKALNTDQYEVVLDIYEKIKSGKIGTCIVKGEPGTGKSIVASYLIKYLKTQKETKNLKIGLVVPMAGLRSTFKKVFKNIDGLKPVMVIGPNDLAKDYNEKNKVPYDIIIVDESHRLQKRKSITNYKAYDDINKKLGLSKDSTQLDWVLNLSKTQILLYDSNQSIKPADVNENDFSKISNAQYYELKSQMRVKGGNEYLSFVNTLFDGGDTNFKEIKNYDFKIYDDFNEFRKDVFLKDKESGLSRIVAGYARPRRSKENPNEYDIEIDGIKMFWNSINTDWVNSENALHEVGCVHTVQGYDLNYVGVILGEELSYNKKTGEFIIKKENYHDKKGKMGVNNEYELKRYIINIYKTLLTRGILGTYVYVVDKDLREYLKSKISK